MTDVVSIVLAAGLSRRMGRANKLLLPINGMPMVQNAVRACRAVSDGPVIVVTGYEQQTVCHALQGEEVSFVENAAYAEGQMTSVDAGLRAAPEATCYLLALGDQPNISAQNLAGLIAAHQADASGRITVPFVDGVRGNPIVIPAAQRQHMLADPVNLGCRKLTRTFPELVHQYQTDDRSFVMDIDTPDELALASAMYERG